jgi:hypothetical protein
MIDIHTHPCNLRDQAAYDYFEQKGEIPETVLEPYLQAVSDVDKAVVLALWAPISGIEASNEFVAVAPRCFLLDAGRPFGRGEAFPVG